MSSVQTQSITDRILGLPMGRTVKGFLDYMVVEAGLSANTVLGYGRDLKGFLEFCRDRHVRDLRQITPLLIQQYMQVLAEQSKADSSIKRFLVAVRMLLRFGKLHKMVEDDLTSVMESPKIWQRLPIVCNKQQVLDLLGSPDPKDPYYLRDRAILELLYATGVRASELAGLRVSDLNLSIGYLRCLGKGHRERVIPVGRMAIEATVDYLRDLRPKLADAGSGDSLLLSRTGRPLSRIEIWRLVRKYAVRAGMPRGVTTHTLRHCFATHLLSGGADLRSALTATFTSTNHRHPHQALDYRAPADLCPRRSIRKWSLP